MFTIIFQTIRLMGNKIKISWWFHLIISVLIVKQNQFSTLKVIQLIILDTDTLVHWLPVQIETFFPTTFHIFPELYLSLPPKKNKPKIVSNKLTLKISVMPKFCFRRLVLDCWTISTLFGAIDDWQQFNFANYLQDYLIFSDQWEAKLVALVDSFVDFNCSW